MIWSERGIKKFEWQNGVEIFYGYMWWIERESGNIEKAEKLIKDWLNINPRNPLLTLNNGYLEKAKGNNNLAMIYFKRTINLNGEWEFWELAQKEVEIIENILNTQSGTTIQN
jgi:tetratricopeptide (TPR) repeat protein